MPLVVRDQDTVNFPAIITATRQQFVSIHDLGDGPRFVVVGAAGANPGDPVAAHDGGIHLAATMAAPAKLYVVIFPLSGIGYSPCTIGDAATCAHTADTSSAFVNIT